MKPARPRLLGSIVLLLIGALVVRLALPVYRERCAIQRFQGRVDYCALHLSWKGLEWRPEPTRKTPVGRWILRAEYAVLDDFGLSDADMTAVAAFRHASMLTLDHNPIGDQGVACLRDLDLLEELSLRGTRLSDAGLAPLKSLSRLRDLYLDETAVTARGLAELTPLVALELLSLNDLAIGDECLPSLQKLFRLRTLRLDGTRVTCDGLLTLSRLQLEELSLLDVTLSDAEYNRLRDQWPHANIIH